MSNAINTNVSDAVKALKASRTYGFKFTGMVRENTSAKDYSFICQVADKVAASVPVAKDESGKDANSNERADYVRTIRRALSIVGGERNQKLTIKQVEGVYQVTVTVPDVKDANVTKAIKAALDKADATNGDDNQAQADDVTQALAIVTANIANPKVFAAIKAAMQAHLQANA